MQQTASRAPGAVFSSYLFWPLILWHNENNNGLLSLYIMLELV